MFLDPRQNTNVINNYNKRMSLPAAARPCTTAACHRGRREGRARGRGEWAERAR